MLQLRERHRRLCERNGLQPGAGDALQMTRLRGRSHKGQC
jgi:hypothetical protein